jgi:RNA polymerase-binding protein DksA
MNQYDIEKYKSLLLGLKEQSLKQLEEGEAEISINIRESSGENSSYSFHLADMGTDSNDREKAFLIASKESDQIKEIFYALEKIENGEFGICEQCQAEINQHRLEAIPYARLCLDCKSKEEQI